MAEFVFQMIKARKSYGDRVILDDVTLSFLPGAKIGVVGPNGMGKSTLLKIMAGLETVSNGEASLTPGFTVGILQQEPPLDDTKTVGENIKMAFGPIAEKVARFNAIGEEMANPDADFDALMDEMGKLQTEIDAANGWDLDSQLEQAMDALQCPDMDTPVSVCSGGERRRVALCRLLLQQPDILLLDEPTNHLDAESIDWLEQHLQQYPGTVIAITHDRYFLDNVATRIFELDQANLIEYQGNYQDYVRLKAEQDERDAAALHKKKQLYKQELAWMRTQPQARATKQQARINRFKDLKGEVHQTVNNEDLEINFETSRIGKKVVNFEHVDFAYEDGKQILSDFNLIMQNRDRIGIVGDNGVGKSTLLNLINGDLVPTAGVLDIGETVRIGYFSQQIKDMDESKRVINYLQEVADEVKTTVGTTSITELLEQFLFPRSTHGTQIAKLSGGEKKRLYLLKILIEKPNVLLLDEPTNDLDIATLTVLENFLNGFGGPVVTVSHDRYFLDKVANKILAFEEGGVREFFGNYTDYLDEKAFLQEQSALLEKEKEQASVKVEKVKEDKKRMSYFEKQEWATIEDEIADLEAKIEEIEAAMLENASDYGQLATLQRDLDAANETLLEKYERYEYLSELEG